MPSSPVYVVFAGVNGAGKSTFYRSYDWCNVRSDMRMSRVNPDEILAAAGKDWRSPRDQLWAGRRALEEIERHFQRKESFSQETTLAGRTSVARVRRAYGLGYKVRLFYIGVDSPNTAVERISHRVECGGHDIDMRSVERRYVASIEALGKVLDYTHEAVILDNTNGFESLMAWRNATLCWCSSARMRQHAWICDAIRQEGWRMRP